VDVGLSFFRGLHLDDEIYAGDVKSSGGDISGDKNVEFLLLEPLEGDLSLVLRDISVHHLDLGVRHLLREQKSVSICFSLSENDRLSEPSVDDQNVSQGAHPVVVRAVDGQMLDVLGSLVGQVFAQIYALVVSLHVATHHTLHPVGDGS
jgi:hypothetical protein